MKKLIVISESLRRNRLSGRIPVLSLYSGVYFRVLSKCQREGLVDNADIFVLTKKGLLDSNDTMTYSEPEPGTPGTLSLAKHDLERIRRKNLRILRKAFESTKYDRVYVNVGREYIRLIEGIERISPVVVEYASGRGLGPKARHMRDWIRSNA